MGAALQILELADSVRGAVEGPTKLDVVGPLQGFALPVLCVQPDNTTMDAGGSPREAALLAQYYLAVLEPTALHALARLQGLVSPAVILAHQGSTTMHVAGPHQGVAHHAPPAPLVFTTVGALGPLQARVWRVQCAHLGNT